MSTLGCRIQSRSRARPGRTGFSEDGMWAWFDRKQEDIYEAWPHADIYQEGSNGSTHTGCGRTVCPEEPVAPGSLLLQGQFHESESRSAPRGCNGLLCPQTVRVPVVASTGGGLIILKGEIDAAAAAAAAAEAEDEPKPKNLSELVAAKDAISACGGCVAPTSAYCQLKKKASFCDLIAAAAAAAAAAAVALLLVAEATGQKQN